MHFSLTFGQIGLIKGHSSNSGFTVFAVPLLHFTHLHVIYSPIEIVNYDISHLLKIRLVANKELDLADALLIFVIIRP